MKICYINPTFLIRRPIAELIGRLGDKNEIGLFVPKRLFRNIDKSWHNDGALKKAKIYSYSAINLPFGNFEWPIPITPMFFINLFRVFWNYKVIHMWTYFYINSFFTLLFSLFFRKKVIMSCDTFPSYSFKSGKIDILLKLYTKFFGWFIFNVPDQIHIYGKSMIKYTKRISIKGKKIFVLPTGIDLAKFNKGKNIRKELGIGKEFVLVYAGLIVPRKGIDVMLKIVKKLDNVKLFLVGDGPNKKEYVKMAERLGVLNKVKFLGWRKDIPSILASSDCLILPSRGEGLPGIVMEAMASSLPVVASDVGCIIDLIDEGKNGYLCGMNDVDCFVEKIGLVMKDKRLGANGLNKIKEFDWNKLIIEYKRLYQ